MRPIQVDPDATAIAGVTGKRAVTVKTRDMKLARQQGLPRYVAVRWPLRSADAAGSSRSIDLFPGEIDGQFVLGSRPRALSTLRQ
jgi:hypothetical protein